MKIVCNVCNKEINEKDLNDNMCPHCSCELGLSHEEVD